ncbi:hypothetical protein Dimus_008261 [Dionaea muscipula]
MKNRIDFVEFLGTLSRTSNLCLLIVDKWIDMNKVYKDAKEKMWDYVKKRWAVPNGAKKWVLQTIGVLWRNYKGRLKRDHYTPYETTKMRWKNRPEDVPDEDFKFLLKKWKDPKYKELCKKNATNRAKQTNLHTCGPKSFAVIRERLASTGNESSSINVPNELLESIKADVTAQVIVELTQINPLIDIDPNCPHEISNYKTVSSDASSAPNHQSSVGLNGDSSIGANKTHFEVLRGDNSALANDITNVLAVVFHS